MRTLTLISVLGVLVLASCSDRLAKREIDDCVDDNGDRLTVAAVRDRVDLDVPTFSDPTDVSNPFFPIAALESTVILGFEGGDRLRVETTLLPETVAIDVDGASIDTLQSQFVASVNGRIREVAIDHYAQADDGSVFYFGEEVFNFSDGVVTDFNGTWQAGRDGAPPAMIMPANPRVGDVFRPENFCGVVFEEVTVQAVDVDVIGPSGLVAGAIVTSELHTDGPNEQKAFAPDYGEFSSGFGADLEQLALAVPTDRVTPPSRSTLPRLAPEAAIIHFAAGDGQALPSGRPTDSLPSGRAANWPAVRQALGDLDAAVSSFAREGNLPPLLKAQLDDAVVALDKAVAARDPLLVRHRAIAVARASFDFLLRVEPVSDVDRARFDLWLAQVDVDAAAGRARFDGIRVAGDGAIRGDTASAERVWDRIQHTFDPSVADKIDSGLQALRDAAEADDDAARLAGELRAMLDGTGWPLPATELTTGP